MKRLVVRQIRETRRSSLPLRVARCYSTHPPNAKLSLPIDYATTPLLAHSKRPALGNANEIPSEIRNGPHAGGLTVRMPCGGVGHGALYHSQSPESLFTHVPGFRVIMPRSPIQAKGLLLEAIRSNDPCLFMEPKILYRAAVEQVPEAAYELPLSKAEVLKDGKDVTVISYGQPIYNCLLAIQRAEEDLGISAELIDLRTVYPWDKQAVFQSVRKTGRVLVVHESMVNAGIGAEVAAAIQEDPDTFVRLEAPVGRVAGWSVHNPLIFEKFTLPDVARIYECIKKSLAY